MSLATVFTPMLLSLTALKSHALRKGVWRRASPAARALIAAIIFKLLTKNYLLRAMSFRFSAFKKRVEEVVEIVVRHQ